MVEKKNLSGVISSCLLIKSTLHWIVRLNLKIPEHCFYFNLLDKIMVNTYPSGVCWWKWNHLHNLRLILFPTQSFLFSHSAKTVTFTVYVLNCHILISNQSIFAVMLFVFISLARKADNINSDTIQLLRFTLRRHICPSATLLKYQFFSFSFSGLIIILSCFVFILESWFIFCCY